MNRGQQHSWSQFQVFVEDLTDRYMVQTQITFPTNTLTTVELLRVKDVNHNL